MTETQQHTTIPGPARHWYVAAGAVVLATAAAGALLYPGLPQTLPVHWNGAGEADGYAQKSFWSVFASPLIAAGLILFLLGTAALVPLLPAASVRTGAPEAQTANLRATQFFLGATTFGLSLLFAWVALRGWLLPPDGSVLEFLLPTLALFLAMAGIGLAARLRYRREVAGDGLSAGPSAAPPAVDPAADPVSDPGNYRAGIYANRADPRVLVPKRLGAGWSVNAGRPAGLAFYLGILLRRRRACGGNRTPAAGWLT